MEASSLLEREQNQDSIYLSKQEKDSTQLMLEKSSNHSRQWCSHNSSRAQEINKAFCHFLAKGMHPIFTVDKVSFHS